MNKELQDLVWSILPKEFKEEVKKYYQTLHDQYKDYAELHFENAKAKVQERIVTVEYFFGKHNLTSDAEGEEMLTVEANLVKELYQRAKEVEEESKRIHSPLVAAKYRGVQRAIEDLFGSKCLPDENKECSNPSVVNCRHKHGDGSCSLDGICCHISPNLQEPKPAAPKFKVGDIVRFKYCCIPHRINGLFKMSDSEMLCLVGEVWAKESELEPYIKPTILT